ncbi:Cystathionine beta-synthase, partial [Operophtera brumata]
MSTIGLLGAEVVQTPAMAPYGDPKNFASVAKKLLEENPNAISLDQSTAEEILSAAGEVDMVVMGAGTGGTLAGVARKIKERCPKCVVVAVDPQGSIMFEGGEPKLFFVEGIGGDFIPNVLDKSLVDKVVKPNDHEAFNMSREIIRKEGLLCGAEDGRRQASGGDLTGRDPELHEQKGEPLDLNSSVSRHLMKSYHKVVENRGSPTVGLASRILDIAPFLLVVEEFKRDNNLIGKSYHKVVENRRSPTVGLASRILDIAPFLLVVEEFKRDNNLIGKSYHKVVENRESPTVGLASCILDIAPFLLVVEEFKRDNNLIGKLYHKVVENRGSPTVGLASCILDIAPFLLAVEEFKQDNNLIGNLSTIIWSLKCKLLSRIVFVENSENQNEGDKTGGKGGKK